ncbi:Betaine aldehyde dehydrogenase 2, partial [Tolypocladium capitatum]
KGCGRPRCQRRPRARRQGPGLRQGRRRRGLGRRGDCRRRRLQFRAELLLAGAHLRGRKGARCLCRGGPEGARGLQAGRSFRQVDPRRARHFEALQGGHRGARQGRLRQGRQGCHPGKRKLQEPPTQGQFCETHAADGRGSLHDHHDGGDVWPRDSRHEGQGRRRGHEADERQRVWADGEHLDQGHGQGAPAGRGRRGGHCLRQPMRLPQSGSCVDGVQELGQGPDTGPLRLRTVCQVQELPHQGLPEIRGESRHA